MQIVRSFSIPMFFDLINIQINYVGYDQMRDQLFSIFENTYFFILEPLI